MSSNSADEFASLINESTNPNKQSQDIVDIGVQTESNWLDQLKNELLLSLQNEISMKGKSSRSQKSKPATVRSQLSRMSVMKSIKHKESILMEDIEKESNISSESEESLPVYPTRRSNDEFGLSLDDMSSDEDDQKIDFEKLTAQAKEISIPAKPASNDEEIAKAIEKNILFEAGLPTTLKVAKELGANDTQPPLSADAFLASVMNPLPEETCEFCRKPLIPIPSMQEQIDSNVDQAKLFCCQEFRDLVDFALAHRQATSEKTGKTEKPQLIDVAPHENHKSPEELAADRIKAEKKIRERLMERQNAALIAAQTTRTKIDGPQRAYTEMPSVRSVLDEVPDLGINRPSSNSVMARQVRVINYQLSSFKFMEEGWTVRPPTISNEEILAKNEMKNSVINMDYATLIHDIFGQIGLSNRFSSVGVIRELYPDGRVFMILFPTGSTSIYYPSGNLAISIIRETLDTPLVCVIQDDSLVSDDKPQILGIVNTKGFGTFSHKSGEIRILFDTLTGIEMLPNGSRKRQWYWDGKPHVHAPPFQPLFLSINKVIGVRISSQNAIFINFFSITRQIRINVGFRSEIPERVQQKMNSLMRLEMDKLMKPLNELKNRIRLYTDKSHEALGYPNLLIDNRWPIKPLTLAKITT